MCAIRPTHPSPVVHTTLPGRPSVGPLVDRSLSLGEKPGPGAGRACLAAGVNNVRPRAESDVDGHRFFLQRTILERRRRWRDNGDTDE